jgi:hypothetical protein
MRPTDYERINLTEPGAFDLAQYMCRPLTPFFFHTIVENVSRTGASFTLPGTDYFLGIPCAVEIEVSVQDDGGLTLSVTYE